MPWPNVPGYQDTGSVGADALTPSLSPGRGILDSSFRGNDGAGPGNGTSGESRSLTKPTNPYPVHPCAYPAYTGGRRLCQEVLCS